MALVIPTTLANGNVIDAPELNANFQAVATHVNGECGRIGRAHV